MTYQRAKRLFFAAAMIWGVAWLLPSYREDTFKTSILYGWECFRLTSTWVLGLLGLFSSEEDITLAAFLQALSPWTNLLVPVCLLVLFRGRPGWLRRRLPPLLIASWVLNLVWAWAYDWKDLLIGYYLWQVGFLLLGVSVAVLLRQEGAETRAPFSSARSHAAVRWAVTGTSVAVILTFLVLGVSALGLGGKDDQEASNQTSTETPEPALAESEVAQPAPDPEEGRLRRLEEVAQFIEGYTKEVRAEAPDDADSSAWLPARMYSNLEIESCNLTLEQAFYQDREMHHHFYRVGLDQLTPSGVSAQSSYALDWNSILGSRVVTYNVAGARLLTRNSTNVIEAQIRKGSREGREEYGNFTAWAPAEAVDEIFVGVSKVAPERVESAFKELIQLCGGTAEAF